VTEKQRQVLDLVIKGYRSKQIASELGLSIRTIESHRNALMHIFGVHSAVELIRVAYERRELFDEVA
jgi:DNA-binding CsgD family transcriptional regulator